MSFVITAGCIQERPGTPDWCSLDEKQIPLLLNHAQCNLKLGIYAEVINNCTEVLEKIDGQVWKEFYFPAFIELMVVSTGKGADCKDWLS